MKTELPLKELLRWRLLRAESQAPRAPKAARLLESSRPWWETWPEQFRMLAKRVTEMDFAYGLAMAEPGNPPGGHPVATVVVHNEAPVNTSARILYIQISDGRLRLRFLLDKAVCREQPAFEATILSAENGNPLLVSQATCSVDSEYRIEAELADAVAKEWKNVRVTDRMPFRLILRCPNDNY